MEKNHLMSKKALVASALSLGWLSLAHAEPLAILEPEPLKPPLDDCPDGCPKPPPTEASCILIIDEDTIDNDMFSIEQRAGELGIESDELINDNRSTETGNPWLTWNTLSPGDVVLLPGGQVKDEGVFALPETLPFSVADFLEGTVQQSQLDKIDGVMPLQNQELASLIGRTCVAVVYDSDISINYKPINGNLQGERLGRFAFTVLDALVPGSLPESQSDTSLYDLLVRVESPMEVTNNFSVPIRDEEPDSAELKSAKWRDGVLTVTGESDLAPDTTMTVSIEDFFFEFPMTFAGGKRYEFNADVPLNLDGLRITISTSGGGAYNARIKGSGSARTSGPQPPFEDPFLDPFLDPFEGLFADPF